MRVLMSAIAMASSLFCVPSPAQTHLVPGKPAGVRLAGATSERREVILITGIMLASAGLAIVLVTGKNNSAATTSTGP